MQSTSGCCSFHILNCEAAEKAPVRLKSRWAFRHTLITLGMLGSGEMSLHPTGEDREDDAEDGERPEVPEGVLRGIEDLDEGRTASKEDLESVLKY